MTVFFLSSSQHRGQLNGNTWSDGMTVDGLRNCRGEQVMISLMDRLCELFYKI